MSVDLAQRKRIWDLQTEIDQTRLELKAINKAIAELPEAVALREAQEALVEATLNLKAAMRSNRDYARLAAQRGELKWHLDDLKDQQNHTWAPISRVPAWKSCGIRTTCLTPSSPSTAWTPSTAPSTSPSFRSSSTLE